jgi:hypothetical protein
VDDYCDDRLYYSVSRDEQREFKREVCGSMMDGWDRLHTDQVAQAAHRLWTCAARLHAGGPEFCSILNFACMNDRCARPLAVLARAVNQLCVDQRNPIHPTEYRAFRGGGFKEASRCFFETGKRFRQPAFLPTSFSYGVAKKFLPRRTPARSVIMWEIRIYRDRGCRHVNLVANSVVDDDEQEYLFAPYSVFEVHDVKWAQGTVHNPHRVVLTAAVDNKDAPEDLPLAPCS